MLHRLRLLSLSLGGAGCVGARVAHASSSDADAQPSSLAKRARAAKVISTKVSSDDVGDHFKVVVSLPPDYAAKVEKVAGTQGRFQLPY